jgi:hypothetical protein
MSGLPEAVQRQVDRAEKISKELSDKNKMDTHEEAPKDTSDEPKETPESKPEPEAPRDEWKDRYNTLKGKYDHEVPRLHAELRLMREQVQAMNQQLQSKQQEKETPEQSDLNPDAFDEYGEEFSQLARAYQAQKAEIARLKEAMGDVVQGQNQTKQESFWSKLEQKIPDWKDQNADPSFLEWLGEVDPVSGWLRQSILESAQNALDVERVASIFEAWPGKQKPTKKRPPVESLVAPSRSVSNPNGNVPQQATYSRGDIADFYKKSAANRFPFSFKGKMITSEEEAGAVSRDISLAANEGRITQ